MSPCDVSSSDVKEIQMNVHNHLKYAQSKRLNNIDMDDNLKLEHEFLTLYKPGGIAHRCMLWIRDEYNLPYLLTFHEKSINGTIGTTGLSEKEICRHREKTKRVIEGYNNFDASILYYNNGGIMDEIEINIKHCSTEDELQRYVMSLVTPFCDFADAFNSKSKIDNLKSILVKLEQELKSLNRNNDIIEDHQKRIAVINKDILLINMEYCLGQFWKWMITYGKRLASLLLLYKVNFMDVQEQCGIYLVGRIRPQDYIDHKRICSKEQAKFLLKQLSQKKNIVNAEVSTYNEIVDKVYSIYQELEKYPSNYKDKNEEALRDFILPSLQTLLTNITATGETFNCQGTTDICIKRTDGSNVFIGECKIWKGPKALIEAINQLFNRYLTWKDTGASIIIFVKNKNFTQRIDTAYKTIKKHPLYLREISPTKEKEAFFSFIFHHVQDPKREIKMTFMLFHYNI